MPGGLSSVALGVGSGGFGATLASAWPLLTALFLVAFGVAFAVTAFVAGRRRTLGEPELEILPEAREREALAEELEREMEAGEPIEEAPPETVAAPVAPAPGDRAERLRAAFESGRITKDAYEANLAKLGVAVTPVPEPSPAIRSLSESEPAPPPAPAPPEGVEAKVARVQAALESGKITRAAYEANLAKLGVSAPVDAEAPSEEDLKARKVERLRAMAAEGRISREALAANLRKLGVAPEREPEELEPEEIPREDVPPPAPAAPSADERVAKIQAAFEAGRIPRAAYESNLRKLGVEPEPEAPPAAVPAPEELPAPPSVEDTVAKLRAAYEAGRIPRAAYESNLRKLGIGPEPEEPPTPSAPAPAISPPEERVARLHEAYRAGRVPRALYVRNVMALGGTPVPEAAWEPPPVAPPPPPEVAAPPPPAPVPPPTLTPAERLAKIRAAFTSGKITREAYVANARALGFDVRALGLEMAVEAPVPRPAMSREERLARMHAAYREGRMARGVYVENVTSLGGEPLPEPAKVTKESPKPPVSEPPKASPAVPTKEERAARLRALLEAGRMTPEAYEANLAKLGMMPPPPEVVNPPAPEAPAAAVNVEERADLLTSMFANGRISRAVYEKNLARVYEGADPRLVSLRLALADGRIPRATYEANARRLRGGT